MLKVGYAFVLQFTKTTGLRRHLVCIDKKSFDFYFTFGDIKLIVMKI